MDSIEGLRERIAELEEALGEARLQLEYLSEKFGATGTGNTTLARIKMALAGSATYDRELEHVVAPRPGGTRKCYLPECVKVGVCMHRGTDGSYCKSPRHPIMGHQA